MGSILALLGIGFGITGVAAPMIWPEIPRWIAIGMFLFGVIIVLVSLFFLFKKSFPHFKPSFSIPKWLGRKQTPKEWPEGTWFGKRFVFLKPFFLDKIEFDGCSEPEDLKDHLRAEYTAAQNGQPVHRESRRIIVRYGPPNGLTTIQYKIRILNYTGIEGFRVVREGELDDFNYREQGKINTIMDSRSSINCEFILSNFKDEETVVEVFALEWTEPD